ncbi:MAG: histidine phosphatase family protein [Thermomicrobiales bacterium]
MVEPPRHLVLIKHARPVVTPGTAPTAWPLSAQGQTDCALLAARLRHYRPARIISSDERKARETAQLLARHLAFIGDLASIPGLREHARTPADFFPTQAAFEAAVRDLFAHPDTLVFGQETANQAHARFTTAIEQLLADTPAGDLLVVAHGTVLTLFAAPYAGGDPFTFWQQLSLPAFIALALPDLRPIEIVFALDAHGDA